MNGRWQPARAGFQSAENAYFPEASAPLAGPCDRRAAALAKGREVC